MGARGPAPKPTALKKLRGTYRPDRAQDGEVFPDPPPDLSSPPWLSERAREKWNQMAPMLVDQGLLTACDLDTLALYCSTWDRWRGAAENLDREGSTTTAQSGYQQISPHYTIAKNSLAELRALADRLGLNPSARTRIGVSPQEQRKDDLLV